ncbi:hypothetical protein FHW58_003188 [Duganella sp. 1224]|uniref:gel scht n=1 Tax=Duganella sp. 1224 TaxID=2587052 RepID=UPI0015CD4C50|nr:gel scht [Duganella sp. 1224]NYE61981.1 hypothetical protein [Duganella sp. 1224]
MKSTMIGVVAALVLTTFSAAHAGDTSVSVSAPRAQQYQMQPDEFSPYRNTYKLANGQRISFDNRLTKLYATLDKGRPVRIYAISQTSFMTDAGVRFDFQDDGDGIAISDFQKLPLAQNVPANGIMVARR